MMSSKLLLAAAGIAGAAVAIVKKLTKVEDRLDRIEEELANRKSKANHKNWDDIADVVYDLVRGQYEKATKKTKRKVFASAAKGASKAAGRFAWNKITRKDK